jgi:hypothetical protein
LLSISDRTFYECVFGTACLSIHQAKKRGNNVFCCSNWRKLVFVKWAVYEYYFVMGSKELFLSPFLLET